MKLAAICPPIGFKELPYQSGYHMALAQYVLRDTEYAMHMERHAARSAYILLDNGAAEREPLGAVDLYTAANMIDADEVVLPDKLKDGSVTLAMHTDSTVMKMFPPWRRMIVVQGRTWPEIKKYFKDLNRMSDWFEYNSIGIPKHLESLNGGRPKVLKKILEWGLHKRHPIHLLGIYEKPFEEVLRAYEVYPDIRGIDTGAPIAYAQARVRLNDLHHYSLQWNQPAENHGYNNLVIYTSFLYKGLQNELKSFRSPVQRLSPGQPTIRALQNSGLL